MVHPIFKFDCPATVFKILVAKSASGGADAEAYVNYEIKTHLYWKTGLKL